MSKRTRRRHSATKTREAWAADNVDTNGFVRNRLGENITGTWLINFCAIPTVIAFLLGAIVGSSLL